MRPAGRINTNDKRPTANDKIVTSPLGGGLVVAGHAFPD